MNLSIPLLFLVLLALLLILEMSRRKISIFRKKNVKLEHKLKLLTKELSDLEKLKSDMLSRIGISLRKPLESVRETVIELSRPLDRSPMVKEHLVSLTSEIEEIENFLNVMKELAFLEKMDLLDRTQFPDETELTIIPLDELLFEVLSEWNDEFSSSGVSLAISVDEKVLIKGSIRYLKHALENILSEISRMMVPGSLVHISLYRDDGSVRMTIAYKGERSENTKSSAFGVELARQIISVHGGWFTGDLQSGQYVLELPAQDERPEDAN